MLRLLLAGAGFAALIWGTSSLALAQGQTTGGAESQAPNTTGITNNTPSGQMGTGQTNAPNAQGESPMDSGSTTGNTTSSTTATPHHRHHHKHPVSTTTPPDTGTPQ